VTIVSVVIPTFGRPALLKRAVDSVRAQTFSDWELIVVIDGDDAATRAMLAGTNEPRLRVISHDSKKGAGPARDTGAQASRGRWVAFLDDDDEWLPAKLERQIAIATDEKMVLATMYRVVTPFGELIRPAILPDGTVPIDEWLFDRKSWLRGGEALLQTSALMFPRAMFDHLHFQDIPQHEEWELTIRAVKQLGYRLAMVPEPLVIYYVPTRTYPWSRSLDWAAHVRDLISPRAYSGFLLTVVPQGLADPRRNRVMLRLLRQALSHGRPTPRQLFAFGLIWILPHDVRRRLRARLGRSGTAA
jgi:glycosyltransferase involved in cell wall biosynthesis